MIDKTFAEHLKDGRAALERALDELTEARSSFWLAAEKSRITANEDYLDDLCGQIDRNIRLIDPEQSVTALSERTIADCLAFMLDDAERRETDFRITEEPTAQEEAARTA